jgi:hypothetical protein
MPSRDEILDIVQRDLDTAFAGSFPGGGFRLLQFGSDFAFDVTDIPDDAGVTAVAWQYSGEHRRPLLATPGTTPFGHAIPVIDPSPAEPPPTGRQAAGFPTTNRPVTIAGVTLVITREPASAGRPMLVRFIDWLDVFTQLGFTISTRGPDPAEADHGFHRLEDAITHANGG